MDIQELFNLYKKEREYQKQMFGEYETNSALNLASFLNFIDVTLNKAKEKYVGAWTKDLPDWLINCIEAESQGTAPVRTYEYLIKIFVLAGAALESYTEIEVDKWRTKDQIDKNKWRKE